MSKEEETTFLGFPIAVFKDAIGDKDMRKIVNNAIDYAIYIKYLQLEHGSETQRIQEAASYLGMSLWNVAGTLRNGSIIYNRRDTVMVSMSKDIMFDFYQNKKTEFEVASLCAFAAIRSILGKKPFIKLTNEFLIARMFGFSSVADLTSQFKSRTVYKKYIKRYILDKIKNELVENWGLKLYGRHTRGFYVSYTLDYESLVLYAEKNRKSFKTKLKKAEEKDILDRVLARLASE